METYVATTRRQSVHMCEAGEGEGMGCGMEEEVEEEEGADIWSSMHY